MISANSPISDYDSDTGFTFPLTEYHPHQQSIPTTVGASIAAPAAESPNMGAYHPYRRPSATLVNGVPIERTPRGRKRGKNAPLALKRRRELLTDGDEIRQKLQSLETVIREHLGTGKFFLVAAALREIDDEKYYLPEKSIYTYAKNNFGFSRRTTNTYLCSAEVYESIVEDSTLPIPVNISHIRSLHKFSPDVRRFIWKQVCESGQTITEEHVVAMTVKHETGIAFSDLNNELYTPRELITAAKKVIQKEKFDLDPASCVFANELHIPPIAEIIYDELTDGFRQPWHGDVWLSPPLGFENDGSSKQSKWFLAAEKKYANGEISSAMILLKTDFGCSWFLRVQNYPHVIFNNRLCFRTPTGREKGLQDESHVLVYMGQNVNEFCHYFSRMGQIPGYNSWAFERSGINRMIPSPSSSSSSPLTPTYNDTAVAAINEIQTTEALTTQPETAAAAAEPDAAQYNVTDATQYTSNFLQNFILSQQLSNVNHPVSTQMAMPQLTMPMHVGLGVPHPMMYAMPMGIGLDLMATKIEGGGMIHFPNLTTGTNVGTMTASDLDGIVMHEEDEQGRTPVELV